MLDYIKCLKTFMFRLVYIIIVLTWGWDAWGVARGRRGGGCGARVGGGRDPPATCRECRACPCRPATRWAGCRGCRSTGRHKTLIKLLCFFYI